MAASILFFGNLMQQDELEILHKKTCSQQI